MPWKRGPRDGTGRPWIAGKEVKMREWVYEINGIIYYELTLYPDLPTSFFDLLIGTEWYPNGKILIGNANTYKNPDELKVALDNLKIKERPHYRKAYKRMQKEINILKLLTFSQK